VSLCISFAFVSFWCYLAFLRDDLAFFACDNVATLLGNFGVAFVRALFRPPLSSMNIMSLKCCVRCVAVVCIRGERLLIF